MEAIELKFRLTSLAGVLLLVGVTNEEAGGLTDREDLAYRGFRSRTSPRSGA